MTAASAPIRIGYCLSLSGPLASNGQSARLAHDIWREDVNRGGGLLGRPVELVCYDDRTDASLVPELYRRLMDEDRVDLVIGGYGTNTLLPAMALIMERQRFFVGLMGLGVEVSAQLLGRATRTVAGSIADYCVPPHYLDSKSGLSDAEQVGQGPKHDAPSLPQLTKPRDLRLGWKLGR